MRLSNYVQLSKPSPVGEPEKKNNYMMNDAGLSAFQIFFIQRLCFFEFQRAIRETQGNNNVNTQTGIFFHSDRQSHPHFT